MTQRATLDFDDAQEVTTPTSALGSVRPTGSASGDANQISRAPPPGVPVEVYIVARPSRFVRAVTDGLVASGVNLAASSPDRASALVQEYAPSLVVLEDGCDPGWSWQGILRIMRTPLALLSDKPPLDAELRAAELGAAVVIRRSASVHDVVSCIRDALASVQVGGRGRAPSTRPVALEDLIGAVREELARSLAREVDASSLATATTITLRSVAPVVASIKAIAEAVAANLEGVERGFPLGPTAAQDLTNPLSDEVAKLEAPRTASLAGGRVVVLDACVARADAIAQLLRREGAEVCCVAPADVQAMLALLTSFDPILVLVVPRSTRSTRAALRHFRADCRLRWAATLVLGERRDCRRSNEARIVGAVRASLERELGLAARVRAGEHFVIGLQGLGPARLLRCVADANRCARVTLAVDSHWWRIELTGGLIAGASAVDAAGRIVEGTAALTLLLEVPCGTAQLEPAAEPALVNVLAPVDVALLAAQADSGIPSRTALDSSVALVQSVRPPRSARAGLATVLVAALSGLVIAISTFGLPWWRLAPPTPDTPRAAVLASASSRSGSSGAASVDAPARRAPIPATPAPTSRGRPCGDGLPPEPAVRRPALANQLLTDALRTTGSDRERALCAAIAADPQNADYHRRLVLHYLGAGRTELAKHVATLASERFPRDAELRLLGADALALAGQLEEARSSLLAGLGISSAHARAAAAEYARAAGASEHAGRGGLASRLYLRAYALDHSLSFAAASAARMLEKRGLTELARLIAAAPGGGESRPTSEPPR